MELSREVVTAELADLGWVPAVVEGDPGWAFQDPNRALQDQGRRDLRHRREQLLLARHAKAVPRCTDRPRKPSRGPRGR
jgi:hypothetical protein